MSRCTRLLHLLQIERKGRACPVAVWHTFANLWFTGDYIDPQRLQTMNVKGGQRQASPEYADVRCRSGF